MVAETCAERAPEFTQPSGCDTRMSKSCRIPRAWDFPLSRSDKVQRLLILYEAEGAAMSNMLENYERQANEIQHDEPDVFRKVVMESSSDQAKAETGSQQGGESDWEQRCEREMKSLMRIAAHMDLHVTQNDGQRVEPRAQWNKYPSLRIDETHHDGEEVELQIAPKEKTRRLSRRRSHPKRPTPLEQPCRDGEAQFFVCKLDADDSIDDVVDEQEDTESNVNTQVVRTSRAELKCLQSWAVHLTGAASDLACGIVVTLLTGELGQFVRERESSESPPSPSASSSSSVCQGDGDLSPRYIDRVDEWYTGIPSALLQGFLEERIQGHDAKQVRNPQTRLQRAMWPIAFLVIGTGSVALWRRPALKFTESWLGLVDASRRGVVASELVDAWRGLVEVLRRGVVGLELVDAWRGCGRAVCGANSGR